MVNTNLMSIHSTSIISEAYRMLRTNLHFSDINKENKVLLITSANSVEGKTTTICNLAVTMAMAEKKTLLLECDLRKPRIHKMFNINNYKGIMNTLIDKTPVREIIQNIESLPNLDIITSGPIPPNPADILTSCDITELINLLKNIYDIILIDTPPVCSVTDAVILSTKVDGVILVTAAGETKIESALMAKKSLTKVNANILGTVLTKVDTSILGYNHNYYNSYSDMNGKKKRSSNRNNKKLA